METPCGDELVISLGNVPILALMPEAEWHLTSVSPHLQMLLSYVHSDYIVY